MYEWNMSSIKVWLQFAFYYLQNSLILSALETSVSPLSKKSISHENLRKKFKKKTRAIKLKIQ